MSSSDTKIIKNRTVVFQDASEFDLLLWKKIMPLEITNLVREFDGYWKEKMSRVLDEIRVFYLISILNQYPHREQVKIVDEICFHPHQLHPSATRNFYARMNQEMFGDEYPSYIRVRILYLKLRDDDLSLKWDIRHYLSQFSDLTLLHISCNHVVSLVVPENYDYTHAIHIASTTFTPECNVWIYI